MRYDLQTAYACDELTGDLQHALAALADVEFAFQGQRERLNDGSNTAAERERLLTQLDAERQRRREPLLRQIEALEQRVRDLVFAPSDEPREGAASADVQAPICSPPTVVLVEEEAGEREMISRLLVDEGFQVKAAESTNMALRLVEAQPSPCGLITDVQEPGEIDGCELAHRVRQLRPDVAVVVTAQQPDACRALPEGAQFLLKPTVAANVASLLRRMLDRPRQAYA
ncbi:response regulator [Methylobacterium nigriterrae]|uniref:response regulator n=1 Tax=Methylobacterium nigriterrae TaxID=3127512 RepID=UPI003013F4A5